MGIRDQSHFSDYEARLRALCPRRTSSVKHGQASVVTINVHTKADLPADARPDREGRLADLGTTWRVYFVRPR